MIDIGTLSCTLFYIAALTSSLCEGAFLIYSHIHTTSSNPVCLMLWIHARFEGRIMILCEISSKI